MEKPLVTENPVALGKCSLPVPISNAQGGSKQSNLREKPAFLTKRKTHGFTDDHEMKRQAVEKNVQVCLTVYMFFCM